MNAASGFNAFRGRTGSAIRTIRTQPRNYSQEFEDREQSYNPLRSNAATPREVC